MRFGRAPRAALLGGAVAGLIAASSLGHSPVGVLLTASAILGVAFLARGRRPSAWECAGIGAVLALSAVSAVRDAEWIVVLSTMLAVITAAVVLSGARTFTGGVFASALPALLPVRVVRWTRNGLRAFDFGSARPLRIVVTVAVTVGLCSVFAALFGAADRRFADAIGAVTPQFDTVSTLGRAVAFFCAAGGALAAAHIAMRPPHFDRLAPHPRRSLRIAEWGTPLLALVALFSVFVGFQLPALFGGQEHVLTTEGLTNAEYARQGFWQLLAVTVLTLLVLAVIITKAHRAHRRDRIALRTLLGALCVLSMVVVASALHRMSLYESQYGFTTLRLFVTAVEWWLGSVFLLLLVAGVRMSGHWLPRAVGVGAVLTVLALAALNPDAYIARHNVERFEQTGRIDTRYLSGLSSDADAELNRLPREERACIFQRSVAYEAHGWFACADSAVRFRVSRHDEPKG